MVSGIRRACEQDKAENYFANNLTHLSVLGFEIDAYWNKSIYDVTSYFTYAVISYFLFCSPIYTSVVHGVSQFHWHHHLLCPIL